MAAPSGFTVLNNNTSIYTPGRETNEALDKNPDSDQAPKLIIVCSWVDANPKHIAKYTSTWQHIAPFASILLIQSSISDMTWRPFSMQHENLQPAIDFIKTKLGHSFEKTADASPSASTNRPRTVFHIFSHGGSNSAIQLLRCLLKRIPPVPIHDLNLCSLILDSTPGSSDYKRSIEAVRVSLPKTGPFHYLGLPAAHAVLTCSYIAVYLGLSSGITHLRADLLDETLFPKDMKRVYLYSKADRMVDWRMVTQHAEDAEALGWRVEQKCFEGSEHCGHIREGEGQYWDVVRSGWTA